MLESLRNASKRHVGAKQVLRALRDEALSCVYVARDADPFITRRVIDAAEKARVPVIETDSMRELGKACCIEVNAAVAALPRERRL